MRELLLCESKLDILALSDLGKLRFHFLLFNLLHDRRLL